MRICLISREFPPDTGWGGVGAYTFQTATGLKRFGHDVEVISLAGENTEKKSDYRQELEGITIHRVLWQDNLEELNLLLISTPNSHYVFKTGIALWKKFLELHAMKPFDIVETPEHLASGIYHSSTGLVPLLITLHTPHFKFIDEQFHSVMPSFDNNLISTLEKISISQADVLVSPSEDLAAFVSQHTGINLDEIEILRNPVDTSTFTPEGPKAIESNDKVKVLFVGRLEPRKGIETLVRAIPKVLKKISSVEFLIVGADTKLGEDGTSMRSSLEKSLKGNNALSFVKFIPHVNLADMPSVYRSADICVVPSIYDNAPYTCIEALASGKPVVVSTAGGTKEYVQENITGLIVPPNDSEALSRAVLQLAESKMMRESFSLASRDYAEKNLALELFVKRKVTLYEKAIARHNSNAHRRLYGMDARQSLIDSVNLLCSFDQMIFDVLSKQSLAFRVKTWLRLFGKRPKLALSELMLNGLQSLLQLCGQKPSNVSLFNQIKHSVESRHPAPFAATRNAAVKTAQTD